MPEGEKGISKPRYRQVSPETGPGAIHELIPNPIDNDIRSRWNGTRFTGEAYELIDGEGNVLTRLPANDANHKFYMGGPEGNQALEEQRELEDLNEHRRSLGKPELKSLGEIEAEEIKWRDKQRREKRGSSDRTPARPEAQNTDPANSMAPNEREGGAQDRGGINRTELRTARKEANRRLTEQFGQGEKVPGTKGLAWRDSSDDSARVIRGDGQDLKIIVGGIHNFGNRENPIYKKWAGATGGWVDAAPVETQRSGKGRDKLTPRELADAEDAHFERPLSDDIAAMLDQGTVSNSETNPEPSPASESEELLDPKGFTPIYRGVPNPAKGGPSIVAEGEIIGYEHQTMIGRRFTPEEFAENKRKWSEGEHIRKATSPRARSGSVSEQIPPKSERTEKLADKKKTKEAPRSGAHAVFEAGKGEEKKKPDAEQDWTIHAEEYIGIKLKPIPEILKSETDSQLFGELLGVLAPDAGELMLRMRQGQLTDKEQEIVHYAQHEYGKGLKQSEEAISRLSLTDIKLMAKRDPHFGRMVDFNGPDAMLTFLKDEMPHLAMRNRGSVEDLLQSYKDLSDERRTLRYKLWEGKVKNFLNRRGRGISEDDFQKLDTEAGRAVMSKKLEEKYRDEASGFIRAVDWALTKSKIKTTSSFEERANEAMDQARRLHGATLPIESKWIPKFIRDRIPRGPTASVLRSVDGHLESITTVLSRTVNISQEEVQKRLEKINAMQEGVEKRRAEADLEASQELRRKQTINAFPDQHYTMERERGPKSAEQFSQMRVEIPKEKMQSGFDEFKKTYRTWDDRSYDDLEDDEKMNVRDNIYTPPELQRAESQEKVMGFWRKLWLAFTRSRIQEQKKTLAI